MPARPLIRVGFVLHGLQVAGAEMLVVQIIERLRGHIQPTIFCLDGIGALGEQLDPTEVDVIALDRRPGRDFRVAWRMARHVRRLGVEILHAHQYSPFFYAALAKAMSGSPVRLVFTEHGRHFPDTVSWHRRMANRFLLSHLADSVNAVSAFSADSLAHQDGFSRSRIEVIENGVDLARFTTNSVFPADLDPNRRYVVNVARFHPVKDQVTLLRAFRQVAAEHSDVDLLLVGDGPLRGDLERLAHELNLDRRVHFLGVRHDVAAILHASQVFVLTSVCEGAPLTLLEAMAAGISPVVTAVGGNPEIVRDGIDGYLTPRGNAEAIAEAIEKLLDDSTIRAAMGAAAAQRVREHYAIERTVNRYRALYERLADRA
jgi:L-malate glycosyltransferase